MEKSRKWVFTLNNYVNDDLATLRSLPKPLKYIYWGYEVAPTTGTPHLQGWMYFDSQVRQKTAKLGIKKMSVFIMRGSMEANLKYCSKEGKFEEHGERPFTQTDKGVKERSRWNRLHDMCKAGDWLNIQEEFPREWLFQEARLRTHYKPAGKNATLENYWIFGPTGSGKSTKARQMGSCYVKNWDQWFCGYMGEDFILLEEMEPSLRNWRSDLLKWADYYVFKGPMKNGGMEMRPKGVIVTSNFHPSQIWTHSEHLDAILRRFTVIEMK